MFADLWWEDVPYDRCPRHALKRFVREAVARGYAGIVERLLRPLVMHVGAHVTASLSKPPTRGTRPW